MSAVTCAIVCTGDEGLKKRTKNEEVSKAIASDTVLEMLDNVMDTVDDGMEKNSAHQVKHDSVRDKILPPLRGTGDQRSNEILEVQEPICNNSRVEKKNRLTDLAKNSKQVLATIISSESKSDIHEEKKEGEQLVEVIDMDCADDETFKYTSEDVLLLEQDTDKIIKHLSEEHMYEVNLNPTKEDSVENKKANTLKRKRWDVCGKIAGFCRKIRKGNHEDAGSKSQRNANQNELKETDVNDGGRSNQICSVL